MDFTSFTSTFESQFHGPSGYVETDLDLNSKLQKTREALQESTSENDSLKLIINQLYNEARVENVATGKLLEEIKTPLFINIPLPRNADSLPLSEQAGYVAYCMKFLGFATRKSTAEYHIARDHLEGIHNSIKKQTVDMKVVRTGELKVPELDGVREVKRSSKTAPPPTPPATPPKQDKHSGKK